MNLKAKMNYYYFTVLVVLTLSYVTESEAFFARRLYLRKNINPIVYTKDVEYSAPSYPTFFQWNKRWGIEQPGLTQSAPITPVASAPAPIAYNWNKQVTFNQPPPIQYTEPAPISYSRQAPALNWNFNKFWGVNPAPPVAHQTTAQFEIKPVTFTIPSIQIPVPIINWNFNKNWGTNQPSNSQGIQSKTNVEEQKEVPIQNPQPTVETFEKTVEAPNNHSPVVASKRVDFKLSVG